MNRREMIAAVGAALAGLAAPEALAQPKPKRGGKFVYTNLYPNNRMGDAKNGRHPYHLADDPVLAHGEVLHREVGNGQIVAAEDGHRHGALIVLGRLEGDGPPGGHDARHGDQNCGQSQPGRTTRHDDVPLPQYTE